MKREQNVSGYTRRAPQQTRPDAFYDMLDQLEREVASRPSPEDKWREEFHTALFGGITRAELDDIMGRR